MLSQELLKKVRRIEITTKRVVNDVMSGQYRSHFKGHGVQFSEHRLYVPGDDVRHIDWKVSARSQQPFLKKFDEERELTVLLVVDISASEAFGTTKKLKSEVLAEIGGMLAYAASYTGDKVGVILFSGEVEKIIPPKRGRTHVLRVIRELLAYEPRTRGTDLTSALESARRILKHSSVVFLLSDFLASGYEQQLRRLARKHDVVAVWVGDEKEKNLRDADWLSLEDPETGETCFVDSNSYGFKKWIEEFNKTHDQRTQSAFLTKRIETLRLTTQEDYGEALVRFFSIRRRR